MKAPWLFYLQDDEEDELDLWGEEEEGEDEEDFEDDFDDDFDEKDEEEDEDWEWFEDEEEE